MKRFLLAAAAALGTAAAVSAAAVTYSYVPAGAPESFTGVDGATHYEACMRVNDAALSGSKLTSVQFKLNVAPEQVKSCQVWLTRRLATSPTLTNVTTATVAADGSVSATLDPAFSLTGANIYVGYTLDLTEAVKDPIVVSSEGLNEYAMFMRTSSDADFARYGEQQALYIDAVFEANKFATLGATWGTVPELNVLKGESASYSAQIINRGSTEISSIEYSYDFGGHTGTAVYDFVPPISYKFGSSADFTMEVPASDELLETSASLSILKVNGQELATPVEASVAYTVVPFFPVSRPLVEEYTGTWCGNCPRGAAALGEMSERYGDRFVGVALHFYDQAGDPMQVLPNSNGASAYPDCYINRNMKLDAYWGTKLAAIQAAPTSEEREELAHKYALYIATDYFEKAAEFTPAAIDLKTEWVDDAQTELKATASVTFVKDPSKGTYRIGYILVQDNLTPPADATVNSIWAQSNYYSGNTSYAQDPGLAFFVDAPDHVLMDFQHVAINYPYFTGVPESLESPVIYEPSEHSYTFYLDECYSTAREYLVRDKKDLKVIAFVYDDNKKAVINSIEVHAGGSILSVGDLESDLAGAAVVATDWYDLSGARVAAPSARGLYIKVERLADGSSRSAKVAL